MKRSLVELVAGSVGVMVVLLSPAASSAAVSCSYSGADHLLTVVSTNVSIAQVNRSGDAIVVSDLLKPPIGCAGGSPSISNTDRVLLRPTNGGSGTDVNLTGGPFAPGATLEPDGSSEIEFDFVGDGIVDVNGTPGADVLTWGPNDGLNLNFGFNGDHDVDVTPSPSKDGFIEANGAGGPDLIQAQVDSSGAGIVSDGGPGNDTLIAPPAGGILYAGRGRDKVIGGGFDLISGGRGKDLIRAGQGVDEIDAVDGAKDRIFCGSGRDNVTADRVDKLHGCEHVFRAGNGRKSSSAAPAVSVREAWGSASIP
jgi:hypothetical protein